MQTLKTCTEVKQFMMGLRWQDINRSMRPLRRYNITSLKGDHTTADHTITNTTDASKLL